MKFWSESCVAVKTKTIVSYIVFRLLLRIYLWNWLLMENIFCSNDFAEDYQGGDDMGGGEFDSGKWIFPPTKTSDAGSEVAQRSSSNTQLFLGKYRTAEQPNRAGTCIEMLANSIEKVLFGREAESTGPIHQSSWSELSSCDVLWHSADTFMDFFLSLKLRLERMDVARRFS